MTGDEKCEPYFLRLNVPFDVERPEDARFVKELETIPNGLKAALVRLLLLRALPRQKEELQDLLAAAYHDQQSRGRVRGRPRTAGQRKLVARAAEVDALSGQPESESVVAPVEKVKVVVPVAPVVPVAADVGGDAGNDVDVLQQYTSLLGTSKW
jgi:hypothetical protein